MKISVTLATAITVAAAAYKGNFTSGCTDVHLLEGRTGHANNLQASCKTDGVGPTEFRESNIDLNLCLGINQTSAQLAWSIYGKYSLYCSNCSLAIPVVLSCTCKSLSGGRTRLSSINLNDGISNDAGVLKCMGGVGS